jgi:hypothetical protein
VSVCNFKFGLYELGNLNFTIGVYAIPGATQLTLEKGTSWFIINKKNMGDGKVYRI